MNTDNLREEFGKSVTQHSDREGDDLWTDEYVLWLEHKLISTETKESDSEESYNPYCPICTSCGETGCCSPLACSQDPKGTYCGGNLNELKFGYMMFEDLYELIVVSENKELNEKLDKIYDDNWDIIYNRNEES